MPPPHPPPTSGQLPGWQERLLLRIQSLAADRARVLHQGYEYPARTHELLAQSGDAGISDVAILTWRTRLSQLATTRVEIETHASALGITDEIIEDARLLGNHGIHPDPAQLRGSDPVRDMMVDGVANDVWQLQHMAAVKIAHRHLFDPDSAGIAAPNMEAAQFERNMASLWMRANTVAQAVGLRADEYAGMWATDADGWQQVLTATVFTYDPDAVEERWRVYAWRGIADAAERTLAAVGIDLANAHNADPVPSPHAMLTQAEHALYSAPGTAEETAATQAVDAALPVGTGTEWTTEQDATAAWNSSGSVPQSGVDL